MHHTNTVSLFITAGERLVGVGILLLWLDRRQTGSWPQTGFGKQMTRFWENRWLYGSYLDGPA
jgi:hypothetical protein